MPVLPQRSMPWPDGLTNQAPPAGRIVGYMCTTKPDQPQRLTHDADIRTSPNNPIGPVRYR